MNEANAAAQSCGLEAGQDPQAPVLAFLADSTTHGLTAPVTRIDTAGAIVFLAGENVYKVKRAVRFPFMDLSTLEKRRAACEAEIAVNRANAPAIYIRALPITRRGGALILGGDGEPIEWATHMRRFDEKATLDHVIARGEFSGALIDRLSEAVRRSHQAAPLRDGRGCALSLATYIDQNEAAFADWPDLFPAGEARQLIADQRLAFALVLPLLEARGRLGLTRRCHGDLHARNIAVIDGEPVLFDAIEFSDEIASGDVLYDLAFLLMDLEQRDQRAAANRLFNGYLAADAAAHIDGLAALPLFLSLRAAIRAKVEAAGADRGFGAARDEARDLARRYFQRSVGFLRYAPARLAAIGGLSGVGKSALAGRLAARLGRAPGALWLRSDVERKAAACVQERAALGAEAYTPEARQDIYRRIADKARRALRAGHSVILDATFASARDRRAARDIAIEIGCGFDGLWLEASLDERLRRIGARPKDASDADASVAVAQRAEPVREPGWTIVCAEGDLMRTAKAAEERLKI